MTRTARERWSRRLRWTLLVAPVVTTFVGVLFIDSTGVREMAPREFELRAARGEIARVRIDDRAGRLGVRLSDGHSATVECSDCLDAGIWHGASADYRAVEAPRPSVRILTAAAVVVGALAVGFTCTWRRWTQRIGVLARARLRRQPPDQRRATAVHEAGHAIPALADPAHCKIKRVAIVGRNKAALGDTTGAIRRKTPKLIGLESELIQTVAGYVADRRVLGDNLPMFGGRSDRREGARYARLIARHSLGISRRALRGDRWMGHPRAAEIHAEERRIYAEAEREADRLLDEYADLHEAIADELVRRARLSAGPLRRLAREHGLPGPHPAARRDRE